MESLFLELLISCQDQSEALHLKVLCYFPLFSMSNGTPYIIAKPCATPTDGTNTVAADPGVSYAFGGTYNYSCQANYCYGGNKTSTCTADGTWSLTPPTCSGKVSV